MSKKGFSHEAPHEGETNEWLTPPDLLKALGEFDLDPCAPVERPWDMAREHYTIKDDGLSKVWPEGRIYCNPPYGPHTGKWLEKLYEHGNGIALVFARTETRTFQRFVWGKTDALLFLYGRLRFHKTDGSRAESAGAPSVLIAYGKENIEVLRTCIIPGAFVDIGHLKNGSRSFSTNLSLLECFEETLASCSPSLNPPTAPCPGQLWKDTTSNLMKRRNQENTAWNTVEDLTAKRSEDE